jgi:hypothetical protein
MKTDWWVDVQSHIFYFGTSWRRVGRLTPRSLYHNEEPPVLIAWRLGRPQSPSGLRGEEKMLEATRTGSYAICPAFTNLIWMHATASVVKWSEFLWPLDHRVSGYIPSCPGFYFRHYQTFWEVVGLERGTLSLVSTIEEGTWKKN